MKTPECVNLPDSILEKGDNTIVRKRGGTRKRRHEEKREILSAYTPGMPKVESQQLLGRNIGIFFKKSQ